MSLAAYFNLWKLGLATGVDAPSEYPGWPEVGIAIIGDFSGIQNFVLRPVPGVGQSHGDCGADPFGSVHTPR